MKIAANITNTSHDLERYKDEEDIRQYCRAHSIDGLELLPIDGNFLGIIPKEAVLGLHLTYHNAWVDFWNGEEEGVLSEFGTIEEAKRQLGSSREEIIKRYKAQLDFAESINAKYVVFHVSDVSIEETLSYRLKHSDEEVVKASLELINSVIEGGRYSFYFLTENLWWPGLNMKRPEITRLLLDGINYDKKGIMLDIGHLLHTNTNLRSQEEGVEYIHSVLDLHGELCSYIKGVHLHQSLSGEFVENLIKNPPKLEGTYFDKLCTAYSYVLNIDTHKPFTGKGITELVKRISPEFLTLEFMSRSREELESYHDMQIESLFGKTKRSIL
jgi:sugar phosphate isomerase/epimerase